MTVVAKQAHSMLMPEAKSVWSQAQSKGKGSYCVVVVPR